eukprot:11660259-Alexandrium_andersonii.AAC.1
MAKPSLLGAFVRRSPWPPSAQGALRARRCVALVCTRCCRKRRESKKQQRARRLLGECAVGRNRTCGGPAACARVRRPVGSFERP